MPWCEDCAQLRSADTLTEEGGCPDCGAVLGEPPTVPWHFKLLLVATVVYLGWRAWQGIVWLIGKL